MNIVTIQDKTYPGLLKQIPDAPKKLYYKGDWDSAIFEHCLAVVGTRRITSYGKRITEQLVGGIAGAGITIVSGFMYGVDAAAHKAALRVGGKTIAVMPCGISMIHPSDQADLYKEILEMGGLVLSEYEGNFQPLLWTYPKRNRIVAGLSRATLVVEAGEKSGSLITANFAKKYKRKLFVVPGPLTSSVSAGISELMREGAAIATRAKDILDFYDIKSEARNPKSEILRQAQDPERSRGTNSSMLNSKTANTLEQKILEQLRAEPKEIDELARVLEISIALIGGALSLLELSGSITKEGGKYNIAS